MPIMTYLSDQFPSTQIAGRFPGSFRYEFILPPASTITLQSIIHSVLSACIIQVPPYFLNASLESDTTLTVKEYSNVSLACKAAANPPPIITWRREDGQDIPGREVRSEF